MKEIGTTAFARGNVQPPSGVGGRMQKILVLDLVDQKQYVTRGSDTWVYYTVTDPEFERLGPYIEDLLVGAELMDNTTNFRFKVVGEKSYRGDSWLAFAGDVLAEQTTAASPIVGTAYTTRGDLAAPRIRLRIGVRNAAGITTIENGVVSLYVVLKFWS